MLKPLVMLTSTQSFRIGLGVIRLRVGLGVVRLRVGLGVGVGFDDFRVLDVGADGEKKFRRWRANGRAVVIRREAP